MSFQVLSLWLLLAALVRTSNVEINNIMTVAKFTLFGFLDTTWELQHVAMTLLRRVTMWRDVLAAFCVRWLLGVLNCEFSVTWYYIFSEMTFIFLLVEKLRIRSFSHHCLVVRTHSHCCLVAGTVSRQYEFRVQSMTTLFKQKAQAELGAESLELLRSCSPHWIRSPVL